MTKKEKKKALKEAFNQALDILNYYKGKSLEELEEIDTSELGCIGSFFNWLPHSGYDYNEEMTAEEVAYLCERADSRERRKEHFYKVSFGSLGLSVRVCQTGKRNDTKIIEEINYQYPYTKGQNYTIETIRKSEF